MYDLSALMYRRVLGLSHHILYLCFTRSSFQASLLAHLQVSAYSLVGFVPFFDVKRVGQYCSLFLECSRTLFYLPGGQ
jgi:hypothetical protein